VAGNRRLFEVVIRKWYSTGGVPLCGRSLPQCGCSLPGAMPLWSEGTCPHVTCPPPPMSSAARPPGVDCLPYLHCLSGATVGQGAIQLPRYRGEGCVCYGCSVCSPPRPCPHGHFHTPPRSVPGPTSTCSNSYRLALVHLCSYPNPFTIQYNTLCYGGTSLGNLRVALACEPRRLIPYSLVSNPFTVV
jgi:hypothetical protein